MKKLFIFLIIILLTGCNNNKTVIICSKEETFTRYFVEHLIDPNKEVGKNPNETGANILKTKEYYLKSSGKGLNRVIEKQKIEYLIETDLEKQKQFYENGCKYISEDYKTCIVNLDNNIITITAELNLNSTNNKNLLQNVTKDDIILSANEEGNGSCKER